MVVLLAVNTGAIYRNKITNIIKSDSTHQNITFT